MANVRQVEEAGLDAQRKDEGQSEIDDGSKFFRAVLESMIEDAKNGNTNPGWAGRSRADARTQNLAHAGRGAQKGGAQTASDPISTASRDLGRIRQKMNFNQTGASSRAAEILDLV
jgi:hypothetical protein